MPRSSSRSSSSRSSSQTQRPQQQQQQQQQQAPQNNYQPAPQQYQAPQMPMAAPQKPSMLGGIGSTIVTGMALGAGSEVGHQVVRSFMGGSSGKHDEKENSSNNNNNNNQQQVQPVQQQQQNYAPEMNSNDVCFDYNKRFNECMRFNYNNANICQQMHDDLKNCQSKI